MGNRVAFIDSGAYASGGSKGTFHEVKFRLDEWASWARRDRMPLGFPKSNSLWRLIKYGPNGAAIPRAYAGLPPLEIPPDVAEVERELENLARLDDAVYYKAVVFSHYERKPDKVIAEQMNLNVQTLRQRRKMGYAWLDGRLNNEA